MMNNNYSLIRTTHFIRKCLCITRPIIRENSIRTTGVYGCRNFSKRYYSDFRRSYSAKMIVSDRDHCAVEKPRILITGSMGQLGQGLAKVLRRKYGRENVFMSDVVKPDKVDRINAYDPYLYVDVLDEQCLKSTVVNYQIDWLVHFSAVLSALAEVNVKKAISLNVDGVNNVLELAKRYNLRLFIPSTIGAFGPSSPLFNTPNVTIQRPKTIYGVSKVYCELIGEYYHSRFGVDFRSLRLPGVLSGDTKPGGGTTDYAVQIFHDALEKGHHQCYLTPDTRLPMIYVDDCLRGISEFMETPDGSLHSRTYNITAISFTPEELAKSIQKKIPNFHITYKTCPVRQAIADSWPRSLDDTSARIDWDWRPTWDRLDTLVECMLNATSAHLSKNRTPANDLKSAELTSSSVAKA